MPPHACPGPGPSPVLGLVNFLATALAGMEAEGRQLLWGPLIIPLRQAALITSGKKFIRAAALTTFICAAGSDSLGSQIKAMMGPDEIHCLFILCDLIHLPIHHLPRGIPPGPAPAPPFPSQPCPSCRGAPGPGTSCTRLCPGAEGLSPAPRLSPHLAFRVCPEASSGRCGCADGGLAKSVLGPRGREQPPKPSAPRPHGSHEGMQPPPEPPQPHSGSADNGTTNPALLLPTSCK